MSADTRDYVTAEEEMAYCLKREAEEREVAMRSKDSGARESHLRLAERYADRAYSLIEGHPAIEPVASDLWPQARGS